MDTAEARRRTLSSFKESVEAQVAEITEKIQQNLHQREVKHRVVAAWRDWVDLDPYYGDTRWRHGETDNEKALKDAITEVFRDNADFPNDIYLGDNPEDGGYLLYLFHAVEIEMKLKGYETSWCGNYHWDCCDEPTNGSSHIVVNW